MARRRDTEEPPPNPDLPLPRQANNTVSGAALERGMPNNVDAERFILGAILLNDERYAAVSAVLSDPDFHLHIHRTIFLCMKEMQERGERLDRVTLANNLAKRGQLEAVGLSYLSSLDQGIPELASIESYVRIVKEKSLHRQLIRVSSKFAKSSLLETDDVRNILSGLGAEIQRLQDEAHAGEDQDDSTPAAIIQGYPGGMSAFLDPSQRPQGLMSGLTALDEMTGGFRGGQVVVIAGRTSSGKSSLALNICEHLAFKTNPVKSAYFSLEMPKADMLNRLIASRAEVDNFRIKNNFINAAERRRMATALYEITEAPFLFFDERQQRINDMLATLRKVVRKSEVRLAVIDHLGYVRSGPAGRRDVTRAQEVSALAQRIKLTALELNIPILLLAQLSRPQKQNAGKPPELEDLKDSSEIEQSADIVLMIWREWLYKNDREDIKNNATIFIRKQRDGSVGPAKVKFSSGLTRFMNLGDEVANDAGE